MRCLTIVLFVSLSVDAAIPAPGFKELSWGQILPEYEERLEGGTSILVNDEVEVLGLKLRANKVYSCKGALHRVTYYDLKEDLPDWYFVKLKKTLTKKYGMPKESREDFSWNVSGTVIKLLKPNVRGFGGFASGIQKSGLIYESPDFEKNRNVCEAEKERKEAEEL